MTSSGRVKKDIKKACCDEWVQAGMGGLISLDFQKLIVGVEKKKVCSAF